MANLARLLLLGIIMVFSSLTPALGKEVFHGYVNDSYYLGRGGTPATFEQVALHPLSVFRTEAAYMNLRAHVGSYLGEPLTDESFRALLRSDRVQLVPCVGSINTAGVSDSGRFGWRMRTCYDGEMLIQVRLTDGRWVTVASQGCYNPVEGTIPPKLTQPPPVTPVGYWECDLANTSRTTQVPPMSFIPGALVANGCDTLFIPPFMFNGGNPTNSSTAQLKCVWIERK